MTDEKPVVDMTDLVPVDNRYASGEFEYKPSSGSWAQYGGKEDPRAEAARREAIQTKRMRKQWIRQGYEEGMRDGVARIAQMQVEEIERVASLDPEHPDRQKFLATIGEKILDRAIGRPTQKVEADNTHELTVSLARLIDRT